MSDNPGTKQQKENALPKEQLEAAKKWLQLVAHARADKTLKQRLMDTPVAVLREHGINVRQGLDIRVVESTDKVPENTDKVAYLMLPKELELTDGDLDRVVGGNVLATVGEWFGTLAVGSTIMAIDKQVQSVVKVTVTPK